MKLGENAWINIKLLNWALDIFEIILQCSNDDVAFKNVVHQKVKQIINHGSAVKQISLSFSISLYRNHVQ